MSNLLTQSITRAFPQATSTTVVSSGCNIPITCDDLEVVVTAVGYTTGDALVTVQTFDEGLGVWVDLHAFAIAANFNGKKRINYPLTSWQPDAVGTDTTPALADGDKRGPRPYQATRFAITSPGTITGAISATATFVVSGRIRA